MWVIGQPNGCTWLFELFLCTPTSFAILIIDAWVFCLFYAPFRFGISQRKIMLVQHFGSAVPKLFNIQSQSTLDIHKCYARLRLYTVVCRLYTSNHKISQVITICTTLHILFHDNLYNIFVYICTICSCLFHLDEQDWRTAYRPAFGSSSCIPPPEPAKPVICRPSDFVALIATSCHCCNLPISTHIIPYPFIYII